MKYYMCHVLRLQTLSNGGKCNGDTTPVLNPYSCFQVTWNCFPYFEKFDNTV